MMNPARTKAFGLIALIACMTTSQASEHEGQPTLSLAHVEPYTASFDYFLSGDADSDERAGTWTDSLVFSDGYLIRTVERFNLDGQTDLSRSVVTDRNTLAPVRIQQRFGPQLSHLYQLEFSGQQLTQVLIGDVMSPARISSTMLAEPVVETGLQAVFALALPLAVDSQLSVTTYAAGAEPRTLSRTFHVMRLEPVKVMGQVLQAWRIEDRESQWTYWVRREKPYIVKVSHPMPGGKMATSFVTQFD